MLMFAHINRLTFVDILQDVEECWISIKFLPTEKQQRFVEEYFKDYNATQSAIRAGYSPATARQIGEQNLSKLDISQEIERRKAELSAHT